MLEPLHFLSLMFISQQIIPEICYKRMFLTKYILRLVLCVFSLHEKGYFL